jgi:uncharacterized protein (DUF934 family)
MSDHQNYIMEGDRRWHLIRTPEDVLAHKQDLIIPLSLWLDERANYANRTDISIWLDSHEEPEAIAEDLAQFCFIALNFPTYRDGRAYSSASILRGKLGYSGKLYGIGDIRRDQLEELLRCGFDCFQPEHGSSLDPSHAARFSYRYQASADQSLPLFRAEQLEPDENTA